MKKATIAKLLVVCLIASLLCIPAGAAVSKNVSDINWDNNKTYTLKDDTTLTGDFDGAYTINAGANKLIVSGTVKKDASLTVKGASDSKTELFTVTGEAKLTNLAAQKKDNSTYSISGSVELQKGATFKFLTSLGDVTVNVAEALKETMEAKPDTTKYEGYTYYEVTEKKTEGGEGGEGGNGGGGTGGGSGTTAPTEPTDTKQPVTPTVDKDKGTASATMSNSDANKMVNNAVKNKSENVIVTVDVPEGVDVTVVSVTIPASAMKSLAEKTNANLIIETPVASITLPNAALKELGGASGTVTPSFTKVDENTVKIAVLKNNDEQTSISGGMTARVPLPEEKNKVGTVAFLVMPDGTEKVVTKSVTKDGKLIVPLDGSATIKYVDNSKTFDDEIPSWSQNAVDFVTSRKLFNGTTETTFDAEVKMNRAMLVTVLHRLENTPAGGTPAFGDVDSGEWYAEAVAWASSNEIVMGVGDGFAPDGAVTREQIATFLYRYAKVMGVDTTPNKALTDFDDGADTSDWAQEAMQWAVGAGLIQGYGEGSLNPKGDATRAEVAQILMKLVNYMTTGSVE